jgi:hypothetical protein
VDPGSAICVDIIDFAFPDCGVLERARATGMLCNALCDVGRAVPPAPRLLIRQRRYSEMNGSEGHETLIFLGVCLLYREHNHVNSFA